MKKIILLSIAFAFVAAFSASSTKQVSTDMLFFVSANNIAYAAAPGDKVNCVTSPGSFCSSSCADVRIPGFKCAATPDKKEREGEGGIGQEG